MFFSFMIDYIKIRLDLAISFKGNFHTQREETFIWTKLQWYNMFWNIVLTIVDKGNIHCNCYIKNFKVWETIAVIILIFQTMCVFLRENMAITVYFFFRWIHCFKVVSKTKTKRVTDLQSDTFQ